jgi:hypothetical protein
VSTASLDSLFYFRFTSINTCLPPQSPRQCFTRVDGLHQFFGGLASADLGNVVLELVEDLDLEVARV